MSSAFRQGHMDQESTEVDFLIGDEHEYYAVHAKESSPKRLKLYLRTSERISLPYSLLPIIMLVDGSKLYIKAHELLVTIKGRNLDPLEEALSLEHVKWIKESPSGTDTGDAETFVESITVEGKAIEKYVEP